MDKEPRLISAEERAAMDRIAWEIARLTLDQVDHSSSDLEEHVEMILDHFFAIRSQVLERLVSEDGYDARVNP